jgi:hypothetical protein
MVLPNNSQWRSASFTLAHRIIRTARSFVEFAVEIRVLPSPNCVQSIHKSCRSALCSLPITFTVPIPKMAPANTTINIATLVVSIALSVVSIATLYFNGHAISHFDFIRRWNIDGDRHYTLEYNRINEDLIFAAAGMLLVAGISGIYTFLYTMVNTTLHILVRISTELNALIRPQSPTDTEFSSPMLSPSSPSHSPSSP